jgi:hypothetical protein
MSSFSQSLTALMVTVTLSALVALLEPLLAIASLVVFPVATLTVLLLAP